MFIILFILVASGVSGIQGALIHFESQVTMLAEPRLREYFEGCRYFPRPKRNLTGTCYLNAAMEIMHKMFCYPEFRKAVVFQGVIGTPGDLVEQTREATYQILQDSDAATIDDVAFAKKYDAFAHLLTSNAIFKQCGGFTFDVILNLLNILFQEDVRRITLFDNIMFPIKILECPVDSRDVLPGKTSLEGCIEVAFERKLRRAITVWPQLLLVIAPLGKIQNLYKVWKDANIVFPLDKGFTFPEQLDITQCHRTIKYTGKPIYYRLIACVVERPKHGFAVVRHGAAWYWCNDTMIARLPEGAIAKAAREGQFMLAAGANVTVLTTQKDPITYGNRDVVVSALSAIDDVALPCIFLYERVERK